MRYAVFAALLVGCGGSPFGVEIDHDAQEAGSSGDGYALGLGASLGDAGGDERRVSPETSEAVEDSKIEADAEATEAKGEAGTETQSEAGTEAQADSPQMKSLPDACSLVTHDNGFGRTWQDCSPPGSEAATACGSGCTLTDGYGGVCNGAGSSTCTCWDPDGHIRAGSWPMGSACNVMALATENTWQ